MFCELFYVKTDEQWFLDFEAYQTQDKVIIKEICILRGEECYNYFIIGPKSHTIEDSKTLQYQYNMHRLKWLFGDYTFNEAMIDIALKLKSDNVYIKGDEKLKFINRILPSVNFIELENIPAFKNLNNCFHERCNVRHGNHCARRKAYELRYYMVNRDNK